MRNLLTPAALVESGHGPAVRAINDLERYIVTVEDDADAKLWKQAAMVVALLDAGLSQRELARQWMNARTAEPYSQMHVSYVRQVVEKFTVQTDRPRFRDCYNALANATSGPSNRLVHQTGEFEWYHRPRWSTPSATSWAASI